MRIRRGAAMLALAALATGLLSIAGTAQGSTTLQAGFGAKTITPVGPSPAGWNFWRNPSNDTWGEEFTDEDGDGCYDRGEPHIDDPRNTLVDPQSAGKWDGIWTNAGFGGRCPAGAYDDTWARAVVFSDGTSTVAMVSLDVVGFFNEEIERARKELAASNPAVAAALDAYVVSSTHTHEGPDTMGLWGNFPDDGKFPLYQAYIRARINEAIVDAFNALEPAKVKFARGTETAGIRDSRPPHVIDPDVWAAQVVADDGSGRTLGTLVNWSNHPEALASRQPWISSDFPHGVRAEMESRFGGTAVYFSGSVGGLMTPLGVDIPGFGTAPTYARMMEIGRLVAVAAGDALDAAPFATVSPIDVEHRELYLPGDNYSLRALNMAGMFDKPTYTAGVPSGLAGDEFRTEMYAVTVGPALFLTVPGELFPEIAIGGYGRPDCAAADTGRPHEPVIRDSFDGAQFHFILGLGQDELGYIVPGYDFWVTGITPDAGGVAEDGPDSGDVYDNGPDPFLHVGALQGELPDGEDEAIDPCGEDHYEETVSASSVMAPVVACTAAEMAGKDPWNDTAAYPACSEDNTTTGPQGTNPGALTP